MLTNLPSKTGETLRIKWVEYTPTWVVYTNLNLTQFQKRCIFRKLLHQWLSSLHHHRHRHRHHHKAQSHSMATPAKSIAATCNEWIKHIHHSFTTLTLDFAQSIVCPTLESVFFVVANITNVECKIVNIKQDPKIVFNNPWKSFRMHLHWMLV